MLEKGQEGWWFDLDVGGGDLDLAVARGPGLEVLLCTPHVTQPHVELWVLALLRVSAVVVLPEPGATTADHYHNRSEGEDT